MITWLHLSDLHLCKPNTGWDAHRILAFLINDLKKMAREKGLVPDLILVSGDLAFGQLGEGEWSIAAQFQEVAAFLQEVRTAYPTAIPAEQVFLVPGNHDVDRSRILASQTAWLDGLGAGNHEQSRKTINEMLRDATGEWPIFMQRLEAYRAFLDKHYPHLLQDPEHAKRLCYAHTLDINGHKIGIAGLNSAWRCGRNQERGKLWLGGQWQLQTCCWFPSSSLGTLSLEAPASHPGPFPFHRYQQRSLSEVEAPRKI